MKKIFSKEANQVKYPFVLPALPYSIDALSPHMSVETMEYHHGKHHNAYVVNLNKLLEAEENKEFKELDLEDIIIKSFGTKSSGKPTGIFNNAAQIWNHTFFWHSMAPNGGGEPSVDLMQLIQKSFGSYKAFTEEFAKAAVTQFGSGWAWLVYDNGALKIIQTSNADLPITSGMMPLINCDVWEHGYYIDFRNRRPDYVEVFISKLINWEFAEKNLQNILK